VCVPILQAAAEKGENKEERGKEMKNISGKSDKLPAFSLVFPTLYVFQPTAQYTCVNDAGFLVYLFEYSNCLVWWFGSGG
jgi:hypothetical protein